MHSNALKVWFLMLLTAASRVSAALKKGMITLMSGIIFQK